MKFAIYNSRSLSDAFQQTDLDILRTAVAFNAANDITGFLHRSAEHYYQYIEGPAEVLDVLLARIAKDARHTDFTLLQTGETDLRRFAGWSMGYSRIAQDAQRAVLHPTTNGEVVADFLRQEAKQTGKVRRSSPTTV